MEFLTEPEPGSISAVQFDTVIGDNRKNTEQGSISLEKADTKTVITSTTKEESWTEDFGVSVSVSSGFFGIGEVSASASANYGYQSTHSQTTSHEHETK